MRKQVHALTGQVTSREFTSFWELVEALTHDLHKAVARLRRHRSSGHVRRGRREDVFAVCPVCDQARYRAKRPLAEGELINPVVDFVPIGEQPRRPPVCYVCGTRLQLRRAGAFDASARLAGAMTRGFYTAGALQCEVIRHLDPTRRPHAWITAEFRLQSSLDARATIEARLPEAHFWKKSTASSILRSRLPDGVFPLDEQDEVGFIPAKSSERVHYSPRSAREFLRCAEKQRLTGTQPAPCPLPKPLWIHPRRTPEDDTTFRLLLFLRQEQMIQLDPESSPEAWRFVKRWLRTRLDSRLHDLLEALSREYVVPDDWRGLRQFVGKIISSLPSKTKREGSEVRLDYQVAEEQEELRRLGRPATWRPESVDEHPIWKAAQIFGVRPETLYRLVRNGKLPALRRKRRIVLDRQGMDAANKWVEAMAPRRDPRADAVRKALIEQGKTPEAAKKWLQRRLREGRTLESLTRQFGQRGSGDES